MSRRIALTVSVLALGLAAAASAPAAEPAQDARLTVAVDRARVVALPRPAAGVAIGNSEVASVTVQSDNLLFLTGRNIGETNVVVVDRLGRTILDRVVEVVANEAGAVVVTRGVQSERLHCAPVCAREEAAAPAAPAAPAGAQ